MLERLEDHRLLTPNDVQPSDPRMKVVGTFNPGVCQMDGEVVLLVRVVEEVIEQRDGFVASPRMDAGQGTLDVDWLETSQQDMTDPRLYIDRKTGRVRLRFISHLRVFFSKDGRTIDRAGAVVMPESPYEVFGIEDPRITQIDDVYYITYVAVSPRGICTCTMTTKDFETFERQGVMLPPDNKDVVLFPEKIGGQYVAIHRPMPSVAFSIPQIWIARSPDLTHWGNHQQLLSGDAAQSDRIGGGTPPVRTERGWLTIYHGNERIPIGSDGQLKVRYTGGALLLDLNDPTILLAQTPEPIIVPTTPYETTGFVDNVVFPTAIIERDDQFLVYNGAADECTSVIVYDKQALLDTLV